MLEQLNEILNRDIRWNVKLSFRTVERPVYLMGGTYKFQPLPKFAAAQAVELAKNPVAYDEPRDEVYVFGVDEALNGPGNGGGTGDLTALLTALVNWTDTIIIDEVEQGPPGKLMYHLHEALMESEGFPGEPNRIKADERFQQNHEPERVLANITKQTGLTFTKAERDVRILFVESAERE